MGQCPTCKSKTILLDAKTDEGIIYTYAKCTVCDHEVIDKKTFHAVTQQVRASKRYGAKLGVWGRSLGVRIPKEIVVQFGLNEKRDVVFVAQKDGVRLLLP